MSVSTVFWQTFIFFVFILIGNLAIRKGMVSSAGNKSISALIVNVFNPAMIVGSVMKRTNAAPKSSIVPVLVIAIVLYAFYILFAELTCRRFSDEVDEQKMYRLMIVFSNVGYFGIPMVAALYGPDVLIYVTVFVVTFNLLAYTYGIGVLNSGKSVGAKFELKRFINIGTLAGIATIIIFLFDIRFPALFEKNMISLGDVTTPLSMMAIGFLLGYSKLSDIFLQKRLLIFTLIKMVVFPMIGVFLLKLAGLPEQIVGVAVLMIGMPNGNLPVVLANQYGIDAELGSQGVIISTFSSILTLPLIALVV